MLTIPDNLNYPPGWLGAPGLVNFLLLWEGIPRGQIDANGDDVLLPNIPESKAVPNLGPRYLLNV